MRIIFIRLFFVLALLHSLAGASQKLKSKPLIHVNQERVENRIKTLAQFGRDENGKGQRVAFSKGDQEGRAWYMDQMKKLGMEVSIDYAGNIIGKRQGKNPALKPIGFGSHIDMVPDGGNYDGCVGSIAAPGNY